MAATGTPTPNLGLRIPVGTDPASVDDINYNSNLLDTVLGAVGNTSVKDQLDGLSDQIVSLENIFNPKRIESSSNKTTHVINVPSDSLHFLIIGCTSASLHAYGMVGSTSGGVIDNDTMQTNGITITKGTGTISCDIGSTARPMIVIDINLRGSGWCSLS